MNMPRETNIILAGVGGQGNVRGAQILGSAVVKAGLHARVSDVYGIAQRGGPVLSHVRLGEDIHGSMVAEHSADAIVGLEPMETLRAAARFLKPGGVVIMSTRPVYPVEVNTGKSPYPDIGEISKLLEKAASRVLKLDATRVAEEAGIAIAGNIVVLGVLAGIGALPFDARFLRESVKENIPRAVEQNLKAFDAGVAIGRAGSSS
jgi:indolepyruvate ferredoxin oxidoreductase beta subunit